MSYNIGDRVGDYEIIDVLGAGGMGKVYKVRNVITERVEAMKVLLPNLASDPDLADRFMREIKVQASLQHPNIAALHTALRLNNQLIMLIEFVEGSTIESLQRNGPVPVPKAIDYVRQVLLALSYAHSHGVVHRDIKPANMMLTPAGEVKLMDFGIAKLSEDRRLTKTGHTVGSLYYMSPEQIQGDVDLGPRADLYSLGVSLYEMVTRTRPFQGDSDYSVMAAHLNSQPVPPIQIDPTLPSALSDVILMAIAKNPDQRFQSADAFRRALESIAGQVPSAGGITKVVGGKAADVAGPTAPLTSSTPPPVETAAPASRRGLYMAVGSLVTVVVLAFAALQGPKFFKGSSAASIPPQQTPAVQQPEQTPVQQPEAAVVPNPEPAQPDKAATQPNPLTKSDRTPRPVAQNTTVPPGPKSGSDSGSANSRSTTTGSAAQPQAPTQPAVDPAKVNALREAREHMIMLGSRANSIRASLTRMKEEQARQGLGMRGDISSAQERMETYLDEAQAAFQAGDPEHAKKSLSSAEREIDRLDGFLGR